MRLLELGKDDKLSIHEFNGRPPPYAILSHTWGSDEVVFRDISTGRAVTQLGYQKVLSCGLQARKDGLQFFWVDTCCIDKSSSAELSEAVNSMFRWYQQANKCYVYLGDVRTGGWRSTFHQARWFTRGWTLQELLAPRSVEFFSETWSRLGEKASMTRVLQSITGIPARALLGDPMSSFSISERMAWAANRVTAREEDLAYSLLGIFGVAMPLIYGEGLHAMDRLREEIGRSVPFSSRTNATGMRLLVARSNPLRMTTVPINEDLQYAILSHTWGPDEVSFDDMRIAAVEQRRGYPKLKRCCDLAAEQGFDYVWVDTCCIDKSSSAELQEAICSMYNWYKNAKVCYVYLHDHFKDRPESLASCRWFRRGWTLRKHMHSLSFTSRVHAKPTTEELIAPTHVEFYDQSWHEIGSKQSLCNNIAEITSIDPAVLRGGDPTKRTVAERMSWATRRSTTRVEDSAYCLMGLFNVFMPMLYGEGHRAFQRLQEEIIRQTEDDTIFSWRATNTKTSDRGILARSPEEFDVVREERIVARIAHPDNKPPRKAPPTLTSRGLVLTLPVLRDASHNNILLAWVSCSSGEARDKSNKVPILCIRLREVQPAPQVFARAFADQLEAPVMADPRDFEEQTLCVVPSGIIQDIDSRPPQLGEILVQPLKSKHGRGGRPFFTGQGLMKARLSKSRYKYREQQGIQQLASFSYEEFSDWVVDVGLSEGVPWCSLRYREEPRSPAMAPEDGSVHENATGAATRYTDRAQKLLSDDQRVTAAIKVMRSTELYTQRFGLYVELEEGLNDTD